MLVHPKTENKSAHLGFLVVYSDGLVSFNTIRFWSSSARCVFDEECERKWRDSGFLHTRQVIGGDYGFVLLTNTHPDCKKSLLKDWFWLLSTLRTSLLKSLCQFSGFINVKNVFPLVFIKLFSFYDAKINILALYIQIMQLCSDYLIQLHSAMVQL